MITIVDQIGQSFSFQNTPQRIVSLVPSQTELLVDLGLQDAIQGVTKFCVHPKNLRSLKKVVGGTKQVHLDKIKALNPDIILCNKEENTKQMVEELLTIAPVHVSDIKDLADTYALIAQYGELFDVGAKATALITKITQKATDFRTSLNKKVHITCTYIIWKDPYMAAGKNTFINYLLELNGFKNYCLEERYPEITNKDLAKSDCIFLSSEPYPFSEKHIKELQQHTQSQIILVDGEYFSWYGSRLIKAFDYFKELQRQLDL